MIRSVEIENFKSVAKAKVELGRVNVLIGENGAGKSNFLEALAFGAAAAVDKLDHEFLATRGVRVTTPELMKSAFGGSLEEVVLRFREGDGSRGFFYRLQPFSTTDGGVSWRDLAFAEVIRNTSDPVRLTWAFLIMGQVRGLEPPPAVVEHLRSPAETSNDEELRKLWAWREGPELSGLTSLLIFSPEYSALRVFRDETQILPLGIRGEGLFAHLKALSQRDGGALLKKISDQLDLIDWFEGFEMPGDLAPGERTLRIRDRYLVEQRVFDQRSANEGFLFLLFYFTLLISPDTPRFCAVDNVDASLNPKLCTVLVRRMVELAKEHDKQLILTTHNPAVLDGLDLSDDEQRLFAVSRDSKGRTRLNRVPAPKPLDGDAPIRLSEAFLKGYLGGLPKNF